MSTRMTLRGWLYPDDPDLGHLPLWLLAYLGFLTMPWLVGDLRHPPWPTLLALLLFLPVWFRAWWLVDRQLLAPIAFVAGLGMALLPYNWCANTFTIYACAFAGLLRAPREALLVTAGVLLAFVVACLWLDTSPIVYVVTLIVGIAVAAGNHIQQQQRRRQAVLRLGQQEVERLARLAERERIGRDLHDLLGHTLSTIALKSDLARRLSERDPLRARQEIAEVERIARDALSQVRSAVSGIRAAGLRTELARSRLLLEAADVRLHCEIGDEPLPPGIETALALILREACTNVARHARASSVRVSLSVSDHSVRLQVLDDGRGGAQPGAAGHGLQGLAERVAELGGELELDSRRGHGTRLTVSLPLAAAAGSPLQAHQAAS